MAVAFRAKRILDRINKIHRIGAERTRTIPKNIFSLLQIPSSGFCQFCELIRFAHLPGKLLLSFSATLRFCPKSPRPHFLKNRPYSVRGPLWLPIPSLPGKTRLTPFLRPVFWTDFQKSVRMEHPLQTNCSTWNNFNESS